MRRSTLGLILLVLLALPFPAVAVDLVPSAAVPASAQQASPSGPNADLPQATRQADPDERQATLDRLLAAPRPQRDPVALTSRVTGTQIPWAATQPFVGPLQAGRKDTFHVLDQTDNQYKERHATLRLVSTRAYWYVQDGESASDGDLALTAQQFDDLVVPKVHSVFGQEWSPGIDGDPRVTIVLGSVPGVAGYFSSWDEYPRSVFRYSNEREMIHVNLGSVRLGAPSLSGTLAHEFQHMVHWHANPQAETWVDEGFGELASELVDASRTQSTGGFQRRPDIQLTTWSQDGQNGTHYQASYLFNRYVAQRFGQASIGAWLTEKGRPPESITAYLSRAGFGVTFDDVFADWIVANLLDDPAVGDGRYAHDGIEHRAPVSLTLNPDGAPSDQTVSQYGAKYVELQGTGADADLVFEGSPSVRLVGADATSGRGLWWSNRGDGLDSSMTRQFDLSGVTTATLSFNLWYDTERDFDFLYVLASADGGARWDVLHGVSADDANPTGNAIGPGYSGKSGAAGGRGGEPAWIGETVDLTPYAGGPVLVRFEYVTDQGYNARGVLIDDVAIPEIGFLDDAETDGAWTADGFLRSGNVIPQTWSLQLVEYRRGGPTTVRPLRADASGEAVERLARLGGEVERAVLVVSGLAPRTLETAPFRVTLRPAA
jgi:hypothetical protein